LLKDDFGVVRWDFESQQSAKCWFGSSLKLPDSEGHNVIHGYDLALVWYEVYVAVSVYKLNSAKVFIVDATDMQVKHSPGFVSLAGKGPGRIDTFSENFQQFKMVTCIVSSGTLLCESINYTNGQTI
jgi:hypothetical protein